MVSPRNVDRVGLSQRLVTIAGAAKRKLGGSDVPEVLVELENLALNLSEFLS